jgi:hypothetical protein
MENEKEIDQWACLGRPVRMSEGWVYFTRFYCKGGHIDRWVGDSINNPNSITKSSLQLNSFTDYYRIDGEWISNHDFQRGFFHKILELRSKLSAKEIWDACILPANP